MTVDVVNVARSDAYKNCEFCLVSSNDSMAELAARLRAEGRVVRGVGRRQASEKFLKNCDSFMYIDPANRYELLMDEGLVRILLDVFVFDVSLFLFICCFWQHLG